MNQILIAYSYYSGEIEEDANKGGESLLNHDDDCKYNNLIPNF